MKRINSNQMEAIVLTLVLDKIYFKALLKLRRVAAEALKIKFFRKAEQFQTRKHLITQLQNNETEIGRITGRLWQICHRQWENLAYSITGTADRAHLGENKGYSTWTMPLVSLGYRPHLKPCSHSQNAPSCESPVETVHVLLGHK